MIRSHMGFALLAAAVLSACNGESESKTGDAAAVKDAAAGDAGKDGGGNAADGSLPDAGPAQDAGAGDAAAGADAGTDGDAGTPNPVGAILWTYEHGLQVEFAPAIGPDGRIYFQGKTSIYTPEGSPTVVSLSPEGEFLWGGDTAPGSVPAPPVTLMGDTVIAPATVNAQGDLSGRVYRFQTDGTPLSPLDLDGPVGDGAAVLCGEILVVPSTSVFAFKDGAPFWNAPFSLTGEGKTGTNVAIGPEGNIYFGARGDDRNFYALDMNGNEKWRYASERAFIDPIAVGRDGRVYAISAGGLLSVFDPQGMPVWSRQMDTGFGGGPILDEKGIVYFGTILDPGIYNQPALFAVEEGDGGGGRVVWSAMVGIGVSTTPALSDGGTLYVGDICGTFAAVDAADGRIKWTFVHPDRTGDQCAGSWSGPAIAADGTVYASIEGAHSMGTLYAFAGDGTGLSRTAPWPVEQADMAHTGGFGASAPQCDGD